MINFSLKSLIKINFLIIFLMLFIWSYIILIIGDTANEYINIQNTREIINNIGIIYYIMYLVLSLMTIYFALLFYKLKKMYFKGDSTQNSILSILILTFVFFNFSSYILQITVAPYLFNYLANTPDYGAILKAIVIFNPGSVTSFLTDLGYLAFGLTALLLGNSYRNKGSLEKISGILLMMFLPVLLLKLISEYFGIGLEFYFQLTMYATLILSLMFYYMSLDVPSVKHRLKNK